MDLRDVVDVEGTCHKWQPREFYSWHLSQDPTRVVSELWDKICLSVVLLKNVNDEVIPCIPTIHQNLILLKNMCGKREGGKETGDIGRGKYALVRGVVYCMTEIQA